MSNSVWSFNGKQIAAQVGTTTDESAAGIPPRRRDDILALKDNEKEALQAVIAVFDKQRPTAEEFQT